MQLRPTLASESVATDQVAARLEVGGAVYGGEPVSSRDGELQDERYPERKPQAVQQRATGAVAVT